MRVRRLEATLDTLGDTAIDLPDIWFDAAELITPMLYQGGIPMGQLFRWATQNRWVILFFKLMRKTPCQHEKVTEC